MADAAPPQHAEHGTNSVTSGTSQAGTSVAVPPGAGHQTASCARPRQPQHETATTMHAPKRQCPEQRAEGRARVSRHTRQVAVNVQRVLNARKPLPSVEQGMQPQHR